MKKRFTFRTVRVAAAVAMLLLSPLFTLGQADKTIKFNFKLVEKGNKAVNRNRYAYEFRVRIGKDGTDPIPVGAYRAWEATDSENDRFYNMVATTNPALVFHEEPSPIKCGADDQVYIDWYDHMGTSVKLYNRPGWTVYYPAKGCVKITNGNKVLLEECFFESIGGEALGAQVRIPWHHVEDQDVDAAIYTVLNNSDNNNCSFILPHDLEDGSTVEVTLTMAKKEWKTLKFMPNKGGKTFDGSMRVRMKSPGDEHFMMDYLNAGYGTKTKMESGPFSEAYPYPSPKYDINQTPRMLEGTLMVVEAKSWAKEGVCVDKQRKAISVKVEGASGYWLVPLWSDDDVVEVMPGPCPGERIKIRYVSTGDDYTNLQLFRDVGCTQEVNSDDEVESGHTLHGRCNPSSADPCKALRVRWRVAPSGPWQDGGLVEAGKFSFKPEGGVGKTIEVELQQEDKETVLDYDDEKYLVKYNNNLKNKGESVPCGSIVKVNREGVLAVGECYDRVAVKVNETPQGEIVWDATGKQWKGIDVYVGGSEANFSFEPIKNTYTVSWKVAVDAGYTLEVKAGEPARVIGTGASVDCGSRLEITVTPGISGRKVLSIEAAGARVEGSNTLLIPNLKHDITAINVQLGADPKGLTVVVVENLNENGPKVADITVLNETKGVPLWENGKLGNDGRFEEGDRLKVSYVAAQCIDDSEVKVEVRERGGRLITALEKTNREEIIPPAKTGIDVNVTAGKKSQYEVKWDKPGFEVKQDGRNLTSGGSVACGSIIGIVPNLSACEQVKEIKVNKNESVKAQDGKYWYEVKAKVTSIEVVLVPKKIKVTWDDVKNVDVEVKEATVNCGEGVTVVFTPKDGDGAVQAVTIAEEGKGDVTFTPDSHAMEYSWAYNMPKAGQTTVKWKPKGNVTIKSVALPKKCKVTYEDGLGYTVEVVDENEAPVPTDSHVLGGAKLTVKVTVATPVEWKVVKVNGDGNVTVTPGTNNKEYTYTFTLTQDTEVKVELGKQMYKVSYVQSADVKEMKVCKGERNGSEIASESEVEYGSEIYVYVAVEKKQGSAVLGVEGVAVRYEGVGEPQHLVVDGSPEDGWYKLGELKREIVGIDVKVEKLGPDEVLIVYSEKARGGEDEQPRGTKGFVTWRDNDGTIAAGQKKKVNVNDPITWSLAAAKGVDDDSLLAVCLAANRGYAQRLEETDRVKAYESLGELLDLVDGLKAKVIAQEVTEVKLETYVTVKLGPKPLLVLTVRKPKLGDELKVIMPGAGGASLDYDKSYRVSGETEVTLKAEATSPVVLKEIYVEGKERLGLTKEMESTYKLPPYDPDSPNGNRLTFYAIFSQEGADNCLLTLQANPPEGGAVTALRKSNQEELSSGQPYQRELDVEVRVQAKEGYYIKSVIQNGSELYGNVQSDTTKVMYSFPIKLPAKELLVRADFLPIPRGGKEGKTNAVESAALRGVEIYPNPTDGAIEVRGASGVARYAVYDVTGREMLGGVHDGGAQLRIDMGMLASGFYIVQLRSADGGMRAEGVLRR